MQTDIIVFPFYAVSLFYDLKVHINQKRVLDLYYTFKLK